MNITLHQLEIFSAVASNLSFTRAARQLFLSQPAVSIQVKQLESHLGVDLTEQIGKRIFLTEAGKILQQTTQSISYQLENLQQSLNHLQGLTSGHLKITVASTANYFIPPVLAEFSRQHPGIRMRLDVTNRQQLIDQLRLNEVDLVIMGQPPKDLNLDGFAFLANPLVVIAPPNHRLAQNKTIALRALEKEVFLLREPGSGTRSAMEKFFAQHGLQFSAGMEVKSNEAIKQCVQAGLGLGVISRATLDMELALGKLVILDVRKFPIARRWYIVHPEQKNLSHAAQSMKKFIIDYYARKLPGPEMSGSTLSNSVASTI